MPPPASAVKILTRGLPAAALFAAGLALSGCAGMSDSVSPAFADPAKYLLWDCKQLAPERKNLADRTAKLQALMAKARTGTAGPLVAEIAYRDEYLEVRGEAHYAEQAWRANKCRDTAPAPGTPAAAASPAKPVPMSKAGRAIY
ncbi:MAG: twin-arginine translocation pathway signal [Bradyrhizobium sp.]